MRRVLAVLVALLALVACLEEVNSDPIPDGSADAGKRTDAEFFPNDATTVDAASDVIIDTRPEARPPLDDAGPCTTTPESQKLCFGHEHPDFGTSFRAHCTDEATKAVPFCILDEIVGCWCCP